MEMNKTGRLIEQLRKEKCMTQSDLAAAVGVSRMRSYTEPMISLIVYSDT